MAFPLHSPRVRGWLRSLYQTPSLIFLVILLSTLPLFGSPLKAVASLSVQDDRYVEIIMAPLLCAFLLYTERDKIFPIARFSPGLGFPLLLLAILSYLIVHHLVRGDERSSLPPITCAVVLVWMASFILCYGTRSFKTALFPLCCLFLMIPVSPTLLERITRGLQQGSADVSYALFRLAGVPVFRQGMKFSLAGLDVEVAPECSGIRSCLVFVMAGILASRVYLRSGWRRWTLTLMTIPIAIFKNAVRIVVISCLSAYVSRAFLFGTLHHRSGLVFIFIAIGLFLPILSALQKSERRPLDPGPLMD